MAAKDASKFIAKKVSVGINMRNQGLSSLVDSEKFLGKFNSRYEIASTSVSPHNATKNDKGRRADSDIPLGS